MHRRVRSIAALICVALAAAGCGSSAMPTASGGTYRLLATTSVFADLARLAVGDAVQIESIVPAGVDVHTFEPSPSDAARIASADLIVANGLGLDAWIGKLLNAAGKGGDALLSLGEGLDASDGWTYLDAGASGATGGAHGGVDPHIWLDPKGAALYVQKIAARVSADRPDLAVRIHAEGGAGLVAIAALDRELAASFAAIPAGRRRFVPFHDAFGYFARAYGITVVGVAIQAPGQEPSAKEIAALIDAIRAAGVTAIFSESQFPTRVAERIAAETGATVVASLFSDALGAAPADTYLGAMRANATAILGAMR